MSQTKQSGVKVKDAIGIAKSYLTDIFSDEGIEKIGLEEVSYDDENQQWLITVGFSRPWDQAEIDRVESESGRWSTRYQELMDLRKRTYKVVVVSAVGGRVVRMENRPV